MAEEDPDYRLRICIWGIDSSADPRIEYFPSTEWGKAIDRAREIADGPEPSPRIQVIDAWGMLIAQFTSKWMYLPKGSRRGGA